MRRTVEEAAAFAANWWADRFHSPTFDNGMHDKQGKFASSLASALTVTITSDKMNKFKEVCIKRVTEELKAGKSISLDSDYSPYGLLAEIMKEAETPFDNSPWKTCMTIRKAGEYSEGTPFYRIHVKCGYGDRLSET